MKYKNSATNLTALAILLIAGFGCKSLGLGGGGGGISASTDPQTAVRTTFKKFMDAPFYHSVVKTKNAQGEIETEIDFVGPDRFRVKNNIPNYQSEIIAVGNDSYNRVNDGKWTKMPAGEGLPVGQMRGKMTDEQFAAMKDFEAAGKETVGGRETLVYKFKTTAGGEAASKIWVAVDSGLPVRVDTEGNYGGTDLTTSITYEYERKPQIEAPPVN